MRGRAGADGLRPLFSLVVRLIEGIKPKPPDLAQRIVASFLNRGDRLRTRDVNRNVSDALTTEIEDGSEAQKAPVWGLFCLAFVFDLV
ncbi:hypothetical protein BMJ24_18420, partial [Sinorhizobium medicae]